MPGAIYVTGLFKMPVFVEQLRPTHVVSIIQSEFQPERPASIRDECHLRIAVHDIVQADQGGVLVSREDIRRILEFVDGWDPGAGALLVHCFAGVSRSSAVALIAQVRKQGDPARAVQKLRAAGPHVIPNSRIIALADREMNLDGELSAAVRAAGVPSDVLLEETLVTVEL